MIKVYIDRFPLSSGHSVRGMGVYTSNLVNAFKKEKDVKVTEDINSADIVHYPYFDLFFNTLKVTKHQKTVVTVADVIPLIYPKQYLAGLRGKINFLKQKKELKKADAIITLSETSKKDIVRFLDVQPNIVFPIYLAPGFKKAKKVVKSIKLPKKYVLYVGDVNYNKNLPTLAKACVKANIHLVIAGKQAVDTTYNKTHIENRPLVELHKYVATNKSISLMGYLQGDDFSSAWQKATIYCQPSFYEGFGLPVLEAMQFGIPVLASQTQALVEIAGRAALYFNPQSEEDLVDKLNILMNDKNLRADLVSNGKEILKKYSWSKTAEETILVYKKVLKENG